MNAATILLHPTAEQALDRFLRHPAHAVLFTAPSGTGKATVARFIAAELLKTTSEKITEHPYVKIVQSKEGKSISVEEIRDAIHFTTLRPTSNTDITRIILIEDGHLMTAQAQNALLKTIEEPPEGTVIMITTTGEHAILPTIRSRVQRITIHAPTFEATTAYFTSKGYDTAAVHKAVLMSGGLPGLMQALLSDDTNHPLFAATATAREILQKSLFDRLLMTEVLAKNKQLWNDTLFILAQMARAALQQGKRDVATYRRWQKILHAVHEAEMQTAANAQLKLVLLYFMLVL